LKIFLLRLAILQASAFKALVAGHDTELPREFYDIHVRFNEGVAIEVDDMVFPPDFGARRRNFRADAECLREQWVGVAAFWTERQVYSEQVDSFFAQLIAKPTGARRLKI
jgi:hypothetical protein